MAPTFDRRMTSTHNSPENFSLTAEDRFVLSNLRVPVPHNEQKRIETLRQAKLLDSSLQESGFHRFTSLATRLFNVIVLVTLTNANFSHLPICYDDRCPMPQ